MIYNGVFSFCALYFLFGVTVTLILVCAALWIATVVFERKIKRMEEELTDVLEGEDGDGNG